MDAANDTCRTPSPSSSSAILPHDLSIETGELTPTLKVRRAWVVDAYAREVEALYG